MVTIKLTALLFPFTANKLLALLAFNKFGELLEFTPPPTSMTDMQFVSGDGGTAKVKISHKGHTTIYKIDTCIHFIACSLPEE